MGSKQAAYSEEWTWLWRGFQGHAWQPAGPQHRALPAVPREDLQEGPAEGRIAHPGPGEPAGVERWGWARTLGSMW